MAGALTGWSVVPWRALVAMVAAACVALASVLVLDGVPSSVTSTPLRVESAPVTPPGGLALLPAAARGPVSRALGRAAPAYWIRGRRASGNAGLYASFDSSGATVVAGRARLELSLAGVGRRGTLLPTRQVRPLVRANTVRYRHAGVTEWWANGPLGLEHGFDLASRPTGAGPLELALTARRARLVGREVVFAGGLHYTGLSAIDARDEAIPARFAVRDDRVAIVVDDRRAAYPLRVDPFVQQGAKLVGTCTTNCGGPNGTGGTWPAFGASVALSADGNTALIGGPFDNSYTGAAWVFTRSGATWSQQGAKLVASCASACGGPNGTGQVGQAWFGSAVSLSADGNIALIGGFADNSNNGAVWAFARSGSTWSQQGQKLVVNCTINCTGANGTGESGAGQFGSAVALSADGATALIGGRGDNHTGSGAAGAAWVFTRSGATWSQQGTKLVANCTNGCGGPNGTGEVGGGGFGGVVALSADGNTALIGALADNSLVGAAWIFGRSSSTWSQQGAKLVASCAGGCGPAGPQFGNAVALSADGSTALVGAHVVRSGKGAAFVFTRSGATWSQGAELVAGGGFFGSSVALSGDGTAAVIGAVGDNVNVGAAWSFTSAGSTWSQAGSKLVGNCSASCGGTNGTGEIGKGNFGSAVAVSRDATTALIGGYSDDRQADGNMAGAAWVFAPPPPPTPVLSPPPPATTVPTGPASGRVAIPATGGIRLPKGVTRKQGCAGKVSLTLKRGKKVLARKRVRLRRNCRWKWTFRVQRSRLGSAKRLVVVWRFHETKYLRSVSARVTIRLRPAAS